MLRFSALPGIGEFHVIGRDAISEVVREILTLARECHLALHAHTDPEDLEAILQQAPDIPVIWAHSGFDVPVTELCSLLYSHSRLYLELSFREGITRDVRLTPEWRALLVEHRRRFLVGMDTYIPNRWAELADLAQDARQWLNQLPAAVAGPTGARLMWPFVFGCFQRAGPTICILSFETATIRPPGGPTYSPHRCYMSLVASSGAWSGEKGGGCISDSPNPAGPVRMEKATSRASFGMRCLLCFLSRR